MTAPDTLVIQINNAQILFQLLKLVEYDDGTEHDRTELIRGISEMGTATCKRIFDEIEEIATISETEKVNET